MVLQMLQCPVVHNLNLFCQGTWHPWWKPLLRSIRSVDKALGHLASQQASQRGGTRLMVRNRILNSREPRKSRLTLEISPGITQLLWSKPARKCWDLYWDVPPEFPIWKNALTRSHCLKGFLHRLLHLCVVDEEDTGLFWRYPAGLPRAGFTFVTGVSSALRCSNLPSQRQF